MQSKPKPAPPASNGNGIIRYEKLAAIGSGLADRVGIPGLLLAVIIYLIGWKLGPPALNAQLEFIQEMRTFTTGVEKDHATMEGKLDDVYDEVRRE